MDYTRLQCCSKASNDRCRTLCTRVGVQGASKFTYGIFPEIHMLQIVRHTFKAWESKSNSFLVL